METTRPNLNDLPEWARGAFDVRIDAPSAPSIRDQRSSAAWPLLVEAATVSTFLPRDLGQGALLGVERKEAEQAVLRFSELSNEPEGARWTLTREARREVLAACEPAEIAGAVERQPARSDPVSAALHELLVSSGKSDLDLQSLDIRTLEAMRLAAGWLSGVPAVETPTVEELDRLVELRRLLAPFERMTGKVGTDEDRFFGRDKEIEQLREYVGVVAAASLLQKVQRKIKTAKRFLFMGRKPLNVWGTGGVGKTTLIAKFMLEHAQAGASRFPFVYLDFDRSTVSASNRGGLLMEMCRQVGAQFPDLSAPMQDLRDRIAKAMRSMPTPDADYISILMDFALSFRRILDERFADEAPFLLVFDTFEVVQYGRDQVASLQELVHAFEINGEWPRLRLILSGRGQVRDFLGKPETLELGALDRKGSARMLEALARDAGKPITLDDAEDLVRAIAGVLRDPTNDGVRPLRLRIIGELFAKENATGPAVVRSLLEELGKPSAEQQRLGALLVDGILVRRILEHIRDPRVRALADPGLVVRRVTKDVIREVMTRGTQKSALQETKPYDPEVIEPWIVDDAEAQDIFEAFAREITLIDSEGTLLRHRQDVRCDMLPLIEARRPNGFRRIHQLAFEHFRGQVEKDPKDDRARAEAVYHALWLGVPLEEIDRLWPGRLDPAIDPGEFASRPLANVYLRAKNGHPLTADEATMLPRTLALDWFFSRHDELVSSLRVLPEIEVMRAVAGKDYEGLLHRPDCAALGARMLYRAGLWQEAMLLTRPLVSPQISLESDAEISLLRTYATVAAKSDAGNDHHWLESVVWRIKDPLVLSEILAHIAIARRGGPMFEEISQDHELRKLPRVPAVGWRKEPRILRLALIVEREPPLLLLETFAKTTESLPRDTSVAEILSGMTGRAVSLNAIEEVWEKEKGRFLRSADRLSYEDPHILLGLRALAAADHSDWHVPFGNAITRGFDRFRKEILSAVRSVVPDKKRHAEVERIAESGDGHSLLQVIIAEGMFLRFAEALASERPFPRSCPETAPDMASALLSWHRRTVPEGFQRSADPELP